jgi:uncharacterized membrane protein YoaK (UPF0700 family)
MARPRVRWVLPALERRDLAISAGLAAVAGYVDAVGFTRLFGVFPANQSGNAVLLGIAIGDGRGGEAWRPALAITSFVVGVLLAGVLAGRVPARQRAALLIAVETVLLGVLAAVAGNISDVAFGGAREAAMLAIASVAMGVQTDAIRRAGGISVVTTYQTGAIARIAESVADPAPTDPAPTDPTPTDPTPADPAPTDPAATGRGDATPPLRLLRVVLLVVLASYVGGAAVGEGVAQAWGGVLWGACAACAVLGVVAASGPRAA